MGRLSLWFLLGLTILAVSLHDLQVSAEAGPSESECRPYIEKALHELKTTDSDGNDASTEAAEGNASEEQNTSEGNNSKETEKENEINEDTDSKEDANTEEDTNRKEDDNSNEDTGSVEEGNTGDDATSTEEDNASKEDEAAKSNSKEDAMEENSTENIEKEDDVEITSNEQEISRQSVGTVESSLVDEDNENESNKSEENDGKSQADDSNENQVDETSENDDEDDDQNKTKEDDTNSREDENKTEEIDADATIESDDDKVQSGEDDNQSEEIKEEDEQSEEHGVNDTTDSNNNDKDDEKSAENDENDTNEDSKEKSETKSEENDVGSVEDTASREENDIQNDDENNESSKEDQDTNDTEEDQSTEEVTDKTKEDTDDDINKTDEETDESKETSSKGKEDDDDTENDDDAVDSSEDNDDNNDESEETQPEDDLLLERDIPENLRDRKHISELLHLDNEFEEKETAINNVADTILRDLKRIYENAIKPLEALYKYRDLSNRHFGDPEIFSKPLVLFMGPWSGGKSTIINYLTGNEYTDNSLRSGAEPSPAYFNILMHGDEPEVLDGTQLAADWTFSGLQKFGQGLEDRLRGLKLPNKLLEKVNIVEIPGILEVRKQVSRLFPFNDACQWFIDRADIIFLVYDPAKLDVGPETEAILDQLKGREYQTRIVLNKADIVKPEELLRVQSALIWNISPLMSSAQPPVMYTTSLWSHPYESSSPVRLLQAQERAFLRDLRTAIDKRIENKIASARRFAVRVRNHAKMVDCYLTTYYNHKSLFGNKKRISDQIIESPQNYHIYEGLSTLTNISRYDLPDPEVYRDFFRLNPLYEFKKLSETCTYFRGCPINKLDVAIAYDLPELVGKYKKMAESAVAKLDSTDTEKDKS